MPVYIVLLLLLVSCGTGGRRNVVGDDACGWVPGTPAGILADTVAIDTMGVSNPFITYDDASDMYYMLADGGYMWMSRNMRLWHGPYDVMMQDTASWIGKAPDVYSPEIHSYNGRYYYMATFERSDTLVSGTDGKPFPRTSCTVHVADRITGPYMTIDAGRSLLDVHEKALHPTFCTDEYGAGYMIYCHDASQNGDGTVQIVLFSDDLGHRLGDAYIMFTASMNDWSGIVVDGKNVFSPVMEAPFHFVTDGGMVGLLFTTYVAGEKAIGVAYSETGHLDGPWNIEPEPLIKGNVGGASMFRDYDGTLVMTIQKDTIINGKEMSVPRLLKMESQFEKLQIKGYYKF